MLQVPKTILLLLLLPAMVLPQRLVAPNTSPPLLLLVLMLLLLLLLFFTVAMFAAFFNNFQFKSDPLLTCLSYFKVILIVESLFESLRYIYILNLINRTICMVASSVKSAGLMSTVSIFSSFCFSDVTMPTPSPTPTPLLPTQMPIPG